MKAGKLVIGIFTVVLMSFTNRMASGDQDMCKLYFVSQEGKELVYKNYNAKDKLESTEYMTVKSVEETDGKTTINIHAKHEDKKGEELYENDFDFVCENGVFKMSMEAMMPADMMEAYKDMELEVTQSDMTYPSDLRVGKTLPNANMKMKLSSNGMQIMTMTFDVVDRKVEAQESITTDAGTYECYKITQTTKSKVGFVNNTLKSIDWISEGVGSVRSETYNDKDKLQGYRVLSAIN